MITYIEELVVAGPAIKSIRQQASKHYAAFVMEFGL